MATNLQINANRENAKKSTGAKTPEGLAASAQNNFRHGLIGSFSVLPWEDRAAFDKLLKDLTDEHQPSTPTETLLVERLARHFWLSERALALQSGCFNASAPACDDEKRLALYMRYHATHERAFYKALSELQKLRKQKTQEQIGFERQSARQAAEARRLELQSAKIRRVTLDTEEKQYAFEKEKANDAEVAERQKLCRRW
jgi:hypothetical protein